MLDGKRLKALYQIKDYQRRLRKAFDKKVRTGDPRPGSRCIREVQAKLGRSIHYQADILQGSSKVDGFRCKPFH